MSTTPPTTLRALPVPRHGPAGVPLPTHGEAEMPGARPSAPYVQDALAVELPPPPGPAAPPDGRDRDLPDPQTWAAHIGQAIIEVMHGVRPASQVMRWTTPEVHAVIARRGALAARRDRQRGTASSRRTRTVRVRVCEPAEDVAEAAVVLVDGNRVRALALRLVGRNGRWVVHALQVG